MTESQKQPETMPLPGLSQEGDATVIGAMIPAGMVEAPPHPGLAAAVDGFDILHTLGSGGMGVVMLARDRRSGGLVALKFLVPALINRPESVARFLTEARHMASLHHPHILPVIEVCERPEGPYYVMTYATGGSLTLQVAGHRPLANEQVRNVALAVAEALVYAHRQGIIHRDLKPSNILLDAAGQPQLCDFGLMRTVFNDADVRVGHSQRAGTPAYMSPAVAAGEAEDTRCDIYSFGATLYELLTGRPPYEGTSTEDTVRQILAGPPPPILSRNPKADPDLVIVAETAMARNLSERYASMADVVDDLHRIQKGEKPLGQSRFAHTLEKRTAVTLRTGLLLVLFLLSACVFVLRQSAPNAGAARSRPGLQPVQELRLRGAYSWSNAQLGDWDGDGTTDIFTVHQNRLTVFGSNGEPLEERELADRPGVTMALGLAADIDDNGKDEPLIHWVENGTMIIAAQAQKRYELCRFEAPSRISEYEGQKIPGYMVAGNVVRRAPNGPKLLLARVYTGYALQPRGIYAFDAKSTQRVWEYLTGPYTLQIEPLDLDGDGTQELLIGTGSTCNGSRAADGSDDAHCYAYALTMDGNFLWRTELGGEYVSCRPVTADLSGPEGRRCLFYVYACPEYGPDLGQLVLLDHRGNILARYDGGAEFLACTAGDLDGDGVVDILASDAVGRLHHVGPDLTVRTVRQVIKPRYNRARLQVVAIADMDRDGRQDVVLTGCDYQIISGHDRGTPTGEANVRFAHDNTVLVLDHRLRLKDRYLLGKLWRTQYVSSARFAVLDRTAPPLMLATCPDRLQILRWSSGRP